MLTVLFYGGEGRLVMS